MTPVPKCPIASSTRIIASKFIMDQNHCVPTWNNNLQDVGHPIPPPPPPSSRAIPSQSLSASLSAGPDTSMLDYEMAELTWENGQLTMHGLGLPRVPSKSSLADATRASGMLESVVNQAYHHNNKPTPTPTPARVGGACDHHDDDDVVPWYVPTVPAPVSVSLDALVPNNSNNINNTNGVGCSTRVGSCSAAVTRVPMGSDWSVSLSASRSNSRKKRQAEDTCDQLRSMNNNNGLMSTSYAASPENTKTFTVDDHDSASQSRSQNGRGDEDDNKKQGGTAKSTGSTKRSRAAAVHNQSERKRRDKINQRMKTLQKLVPNSNKTDKASMLDEAIEYLKTLQVQVQMLRQVSLPSMSMMMPLAIQHQLQMSSMMAPIGLGMGMGMDHMNVGMNPMAAGQSNLGGVNPSHLMNMAAAYNMPLHNSDGTSTNGGAYNMPQGALVAADPLSTYLACQSNPMTMDAYSKMAAIYQQHLQQQTQQQQRQNHQQPVVPSSNI